MFTLLVSLVAHAEVVDRVVAVVEDQPVLQSEVRLEAAMARDPSPLPGWAALHASPLEQLIDATLVRTMAADVSLYQPSRDQVSERMAAIRASFADDGAWNAFLSDHGLDEPRLASVLKKRMIVERYLTRNLLSPPTDEAAWATECRALLEALRPRVRVRMIEEHPDVGQ